MERPEIVQLFYSALLEPNDVEPLSQFLSPRVEWILSAADPRTLGEELPSNAIKFSGTEGFRQLALYFRDRLHVISGDLTGCIPHHHLIFSFGRVRLQTREAGRLAETNIAPKSLFRARKLLNARFGSRGPWFFNLVAPPISIPS
jgi:hypothetical protein